MTIPKIGIEQISQISASDITTGTLPHAQLPALQSSDIPDNAANTSGTAANLSDTPTLPNGTKAATQSAGDVSTDISTDEFVHANQLKSGGSVDIVVTANITLFGEQLIDGITTSASTVLVIGQTDKTQNGVYVTSTSSWTRSATSNADILHRYYTVVLGATGSGRTYYNTNTTAITIGVTQITYEIMSGVSNKWTQQTSSITTVDNVDILARQGNLFGFYENNSSIIFQAQFYNTINADYVVGGSTTGIPYNSTVQIVNRKLAFLGTAAYLYFLGALYRLPRGAIKLMYTPNYSGSPAAFQQIWGIGIKNSQAYTIKLQHITNGALVLSYGQSNGSSATIIASPPWSPVSGTSYEIEANWDFVSGVHRIFLNGSQIGATGTVIYDFSTAAMNIMVFNAVPALFSPTIIGNYYIHNVILYNSVQHTSSYVPGYSLQPIQVNAGISKLSSLMLYNSLIMQLYQVAGGILRTDSAGNVSSSVALPSTTTASTPPYGDNSTAIATTAFVASELSSPWNPVALTISGPISATTITLYFKMLGDLIFVSIPDITVTGNSTSDYFISTSTIPSQYIPITSYAQCLTPTCAGLGVVELNSAGYFKIFYQDTQVFPAFSGAQLLFIGRQVTFFYSR